MALFKRQASTRNIRMRPDLAEPGSMSQEPRQTEGQDAAADVPTTFEVEYAGGSSLSFTSGASTLGGLDSLVVRLRTGRHRKGSKECKGMIHSSDSTGQLVASFQRVLDSGRDFVVLWDLRCVSPSCSLMHTLATVCAVNCSQLARQVRSAAVLVKDNIFAGTAVGVARAFAQACLVGSYPFLVCHTEAAAQEFFRASLFPSPLSPFITMIGIKETHVKAGLSPKVCFAMMAPATHGPATRQQSDRAEVSGTYHTLANGDLRVIQTPPPDIVIRRPLKNPISTGPSTGASSATLALRFSLPKEKLQAFVGAHFHIGEVVVDAEFETNRPKRQHIPSSCGCAFGISKILNKLSAYVFHA